MNCTHFIFIGHLLMLTYFGVENVPEFQYCFWLFTDVDYFSCAKCSDHSWLIFMWFSCTETYPWIANMWSSWVIYWCWNIFMCKMFQNCNIAFDYLLMLTICHVQNVLIILDWCLCHFLVLKHMNELHALHLHWLFTDVDIFWCGKCSRISILLLIFYWCWLFVMCKMFLSFSIDDYVIFLYQNICINCIHIHIWVLFLRSFMHVLFFGFLFRSIVFSVNNVFTLSAFGCFPFVINLCEISWSFSCELFQYCFWLFTDVDYFLCSKCSYHSQLMFMWFSCTETYQWSMNCMHFIFIGHLLMLTYFCVENIPDF